jgi:hypothetical protein
MRREKLGGLAMVAGAAMGLVTMALHPTGAQIAHGGAARAALSAAVHALALAGVPLVFFGTFALTRRLSGRGALAELALVFQGAAGVATLIAAVASGFLATDLVAGMAGLDGEARAMAGALLHYTGALNQAFARVLVGASSVAIGLWSVEILRTGLLRRGTGILGCAVAAATLLALLSGRLRLDVHGFGAVVLGQAVWLVMVGLELRRGGGAGETAQRRDERGSRSITSR